MPWRQQKELASGLYRKSLALVPSIAFVVEGVSRPVQRLDLGLLASAPLMGHPDEPEMAVQGRDVEAERRLLELASLHVPLGFGTDVLERHRPVPGRLV